MNTSWRLAWIASAALFVGCGAVTAPGETESQPKLLTRTIVSLPQVSLADMKDYTVSPPNAIIGPTEQLKIATITTAWPPSQRSGDPEPRPEDRQEQHGLPLVNFLPERRRYEPQTISSLPLQLTDPAADTTWLMLASCLLAIVIAAILRAGRQAKDAVKTASACLAAIILLMVATPFLALVLVMLLVALAFYVTEYALVSAISAGCKRAGRFIWHAGEQVAFWASLKKEPTWIASAAKVSGESSVASLLSSGHDAASKASQQLAPAVKTVPAAWSLDRPLTESWDDEEEPQPASLSTRDNLLVLAALMRIQAIRRELETKTAELAELEDQIRRLTKP